MGATARSAEGKEGIPTMYRILILLPLVAALVLPSCGDDSSPSSPTSPSPTQQGFLAIGEGLNVDVAALGPLAIVSPEGGANISSVQPLLTVTNAAFGSPPRTYRFEVAEAAVGFGQLMDSESDVPEGEEGTTSWQVTTPLTPGTEYIWRVTATSSGQTGSTETSAFMVKDAYSLDRPGEVVVYDPLTTGSSVAMEVVGGEFTPQGWKALTNNDYIRYQVPTMSDGYMEFTTTNIGEPNPNPGKRMLVSFWDPTKGIYRENPFRVHIQKMDRATVRINDVRLRWISRGQETNTGITFFDFEKDVVYPWRIEWGSWQGLQSQQVRVFLEGVQIMERNYDKAYHPKTFWIELGNQERAETLEECIWSNIIIGSR